MGVTAAAALVLAAGLDAAVGEPPVRVHPVAWFGRVVAPFDRDASNPRVLGAFVALVLPLAAAAVVGGGVLAAAHVHAVLGVVAAGLAVFVTTSLRMLLEEVRGVVAASATDVEVARARLPAIAGRDASELSAGELRSAAIESAAENLADGLVAPLAAFAVGATVSLPIAAAAAAWVKAVNTLDSMLGYRTKPVGTASARLDDVVMWVPARLTAVLLACTARDPGALLRARSDADAPASPNSGWPMATLAAVLDVRFTKPNAYDLPLGDALPTPRSASRGVRVVALSGLLAYVLAGVFAYALAAGVPVPESSSPVLVSSGPVLASSSPVLASLEVVA